MFQVLHYANKETKTYTMWIRPQPADWSTEYASLITHCAGDTVFAAIESQLYHIPYLYNQGFTTVLFTESEPEENKRRRENELTLSVLDEGK